MLPFEWVLYLGSGVAFLGFALGVLLFLAWALLSRHGDLRKRRLRIALACAALFLASFLASASMLHLVFMPGVTLAVVTAQGGPIHAQPPYFWWITVLTTAVPLLLYAAAVLLIRAINRTEGFTKRGLLLPLGCLLLTLPVFAAAHTAVYRVQVPAIVRYVHIENREWRTHVGDPAPDVSVTMLDGSTQRLSELRGKVVLVNFFATWCGPCNYELPHLEQLWRDFKTNDRFAMLVVDREEAADVVTPFLSKHEFTFPVALDPSAVAFKQFAKDGIPRTYLIGRDGTILFQTLGFSDDQPVYQHELATLRKTIERELASAP